MRERFAHAVVRASATSWTSSGASPGGHWSNTIAMSLPSTRWISIDTSGVSLNGVPMVMYSRESYDFTNEIIAQLNKPGAKPAATKAATKAKP